jgi:hypothetical protein
MDIEFKLITNGLLVELVSKSGNRISFYIPKLMKYIGYLLTYF